MTGIYSGKETSSVLKHCPGCGSPSIEELPTGLVDSRTGEQHLRVRCTSCKWAGAREELVVQEFTHEMGSDEQVLQSMVNDLRNVLAKEFAKSFGSFLLKWGFISRNISAQELSRYVVAVARFTLAAIIETRQEIEREQKKI
jgi:hypothetical protein